MFIESIQIKNKVFQNIDAHNERFNNTRSRHFNAKDVVLLENKIVVPDYLSEGLYKCRIIYGENIISTEFTPYQPAKIQSLKIIAHNEISYSFKYEDRVLLNELWGKKGKCDEVLILKNNLLTDTSYANIIFFDGEKWLTPAHPLLRGTKRNLLLREKIILEEEIGIRDLAVFKKAMLVNAMLDFDLNRTIEIKDIEF